MENRLNTPNATKFKTGTIFAELNNRPKNVSLQFRHVKIRYPSRLEAVSIDESKIAEKTEDNIYPAGQIDFCVNICNEISISARDDNRIRINEDFNRAGLARHSAILMQKALNSEVGFDIGIKQDLSLLHCGLGSSSSIIQGVGAAINELFGSPIKSLDLIHYLCSNHGEEANGEDMLMQVQSVGGSGICGHFSGALIINAGKAIPIFQKDLPEDFNAIIGVPRFYKAHSGDEMMDAELDNLNGFIESGHKYAKDVSYRLLNEVMPALFVDNYKPCKDLIFDIRYNMNSNKNCAFYYPKILDIAEKLFPLKDDPEIEFMSLSSVGPGFFIISRNAKRAEQIFSDLGMDTYITKLHNDKYKIIERK